MEKKIGRDLGCKGKNVIWKKQAWGVYFKCALQVNDFYMKVWNFISCHPIPKPQILDFLASADPGKKMSDTGQVLPNWVGS